MQGQNRNPSMEPLIPELFSRAIVENGVLGDVLIEKDGAAKTAELDVKNKADSSAAAPGLEEKSRKPKK